MSKDPLDLPRRPRIEVLPPDRGSGDRSALTETQMDMAVKTVQTAAADVGEIAKKLVEIHRIRVEGRATVDRIEAETRKVVETINAEIRRMAEQRQMIQTTGTVAVRFIAEISKVLEGLPEADHATRSAIVAGLPEMLRTAVNQGGR